MSCRSHSLQLILGLAWQRIPLAHCGNNTIKASVPRLGAFLVTNILPFGSRGFTRDIEERRPLSLHPSPLPRCRVLLPAAVCCARPALLRVRPCSPPKHIPPNIAFPHTAAVLYALTTT